MDPYLGMLVSGVFRLEALIGLGTTGRVYRAAQLGFERPVAVKILHRHLMQAPALRDRFHREARLASRLHHPGIVRVLASGQIEAEGSEVGGETYLAYEYLEGVSLRQLLHDRGQLPLVEAVAHAIALGDAVGDAHAQNIIHRDLKPENLMSVAGGNGIVRLVVLDFGLARALDQQQDPLTHEGAILGTPQYMAPEAARGQPATLRSDVYSLATILYEMLTGRPPFTAESPMLVLVQQSETEPAPLAPDLGIPSDIGEFTLRELAKDPTERSPDARRFSLDLFAAAIRAGLARDRLLLPQLSDEFLGELVATTGQP
jgi:eukaryotic-like serine/threonine-protein kinase